MFLYNPKRILGLFVLVTMLCWFTAPAMADLVPPRKVKTTPAAKVAPKARVAPKTRVAAKPAARKAATAKTAVKKDGTKEQYTLVNLKKRPLKPGWDRPYLLAAYGVVWFILLIYLLSLARRMAGTTSQLAALEQHIKEIVPED